ncbi:MAG: ester cyclase [Gammaproteobacteria bacterium]|nr:ester cyclase [Gammaproteobacteria bacterium]MDH3413407.1 ester cyclase [Gammaproteobacteria bacterium]
MSASRAEEARNKAIVERYFHEVLDQRSFELMPEFFAPDVVLHRPGFDVLGLDAAIQRLRATFKDYQAFSSGLSGLMADGGMVSVRVLHRAKVRPHTFRSRAGEVRLATERELNWAAIVQFRFEDGRIAEEWVMRDELGMLVQMGTEALVAKCWDFREGESPVAPGTTPW